MVKRKSAGILLYRFNGEVPEFFLVHPGGPFWANKDTGAWSIPKGEFNEEEHPLAAARREFEEETGFTARGPFIELTPIVQKGGKWVHAWAVEKDVDPVKLKSNTFTMKFASGGSKEYPEVDRGDWFNVEEAKEKILESQVRLIEELQEKIGS